MKQNYFLEYVPNAYINLCVDKAQQMANNRFVYDFKAGDKKAAHNGNITSDSAILQPSSMQQASQPQMSTFTSLESASQPTTEAATLLTRTFITFQ